MGRAIRQAVRLVLVLAAGCSAAGQLPTDSPLAQSANGIIRTLAKPFESGDAVTPDPQAARLEVAPLESMDGDCKVAPWSLAWTVLSLGML